MSPGHKYLSKIGTASGYTTAQVLPAEQALATGTHANYGAMQGLMPDVTAMATLTSSAPSDVSSIFNQAMMGRPQGLSKLGITGQLPSNFMSEDPSDKVKTLNNLLAQNGINVAKLNKEYAASPAGQLAKAQNEENTIQDKLGANILPLVIRGLNFIEPILNTIMNNKILMTLFAAVAVVLTGLALVGGPVLILFSLLGKNLGDLGGWLKKLISSSSTKGKGGGGSGGSSKTCVPTCDSGSSGGSNSSSSSKGKKGSKGKGGRFSGLSNFLGDEEGSLGGGAGLLGDAEEGGGMLSKLGGIGGKLGGVADLAMGGADLIPGLGEALMIGQAGYGAYNGWNDTKGNDGDKAKGAVGGAVSQLSMGLVSQQQVVGGINVVQKAVSGLSPKVKADLGNIGKTISSPFINGFNFVEGSVGNGVNFLKGAWGTVKADVGAVGSYMEGAWKNTVSGVENTWKGLVSGITSELSSIGSAIMNAGSTLYNDAVNVGHQIYTGVMKGLGIKSPGFIYNNVVTELEGVNGALGKYGNTLGNSAKNMGGSMVSGFGSNSLGARGATHIHQHNEKITIDASHMDENQLKSVLTKMFESMNKNVIPNIQVS